MDADKNSDPGEAAAGADEVQPLFSAFKPKPRPAPRTPPVKADPPPAQAKTEKAQAHGGDADILEYLKARIGALENKLNDSQEKALSFAFELKGREEARNESRREMEELLATIKHQQAAADTEKLRMVELEQSRARIEALEKKLLEAAARKDPPDLRSRLDALAARVESFAGEMKERDAKVAAYALSVAKAEAAARGDPPDPGPRIDALASRVEQVAAESKARDVKAAADAVLATGKLREELRGEILAVVCDKISNIHMDLIRAAEKAVEVRIGEERALLEQQKAEFQAIANGFGRAASGFSGSLAQRLGELHEAVRLLAGATAAASEEGERTAEWLKALLEEKGRAAAGGASGAYNFGFIQASLDNLEKNFSDALDNISRARKAAEERPDEGVVTPEQRARRNAAALADTLKELDGALAVFRRMRGVTAANVRKMLISD